MKEVLNIVLPPLERLLIAIAKVVASVGFGYLIYLLLAPVAYAERGYMAYGGECVLAIVIGFLMMWVLFHEPSK